MKQYLALVLVLLAFQMNGQTVAKSILVEYGYPNIPKDNAGLQTMFGVTKYLVYADDKYLKIASYQDLTAEQAKQIGPSLRSLFVKDRSANELYLCVSLDTLFIRMKGGEQEQSLFKGMTETFNAGSEAFRGTGSKKADIQGYACNEVLVKGKFSDTISAFVAHQIILDPVIKDFPLYVARGEKAFGLMLGRDEVLWDGKVIEFRALKLEINQPREVESELAMYRLVSKEEGEREMKAVFAKIMGSKN